MPRAPRLFTNPLRRDTPGFTARELDDVAAFAPERGATPLREVPALAATLGLSRLIVKDETARWGLNAFKIAGASYALDRWRGAHGADSPAVTLVTASAGNHGRAVARAAREHGLGCRVFVPADARADRIAAIRDEGAEVVQLAGSYEDALDRAAREARAPGMMLLSDTVGTAAAPGAAAIPALIVRGYTRLFSEAAAGWGSPPDVVVIQGGVGGLVAAAAGWLRHAVPNAYLIAAEPTGADCLGASARAGRAIKLPSTRATSMVYLRCAEPSAAAWPHVAHGVDAFVAIDDHEAEAAVRALAAEGIATGASGACGLAALAAVAGDWQGRSAMIVVTEGT